MPDDILVDDVAKSELNESDILKAIDTDDEDSTENEKEESKLSDDEDSDKDDKKKESESEEESEDSEEDKLELSDEDEDLEYQDIPKRAEILKAYPDLYKKFPGIERAMHREIQFTNEFATPAEARHAKERLDVFNRLEHDIFDGNIGNLLTGIKQQDPKAFQKIGDNLLATIHAVDKGVLQNIGETINRHVLLTALNAGKELGGEEGEQLGLAAQILHKYLYGTAKVEGPKINQAVEQKNPESEKFNAERQQFEQERLSIAVNDVTSRTNGLIDKFIDKYIDPKNTMSEYVRSRAVKDVKESFDKELGEDSRFRQHLDRLWIASRQSGYTENSKKAIRTAILNKANGSLMSHIRNVRATVNKSLSNGKARQNGRDRNDSEPEIKRLTARPKSESSRSLGSERERSRYRGLSINDVMKEIG